MLDGVIQPNVETTLFAHIRLSLSTRIANPDSRALLQPAFEFKNLSWDMSVTSTEVPKKPRCTLSAATSTADTTFTANG